MSDPTVNSDRLLDLAEAVCNRTASKNDLAELKSLLLVDQTSCRRYLLYCEMHAALRFEVRADRAAQKVCQPIDIRSITQAAPEVDVPDVDTPSPPPPHPHPPQHRQLLLLGLAGGVPDRDGDLRSQHVGRLLDARVPACTGRQAIVGAGPGGCRAEPKTELVGRITGMVDCKWAGVASDSPVVPLGRKYELASGLVEIIYDTGAKVILQGPVTYEVESATGGYLSIGKLTGKVEKKAAKGFCVRTPTAIVTDLGTEFGVEVSKAGHTTSHVFRGVVRVELVAVDGKAQGSGQVLRENESVQVDGNRGQRKIVVVPGAYVCRLHPRDAQAGNQDARSGRCSGRRRRILRAAEPGPRSDHRESD